MKYPQFHKEVLAELEAIGSPSFALHTPKDRRSEMLYSGVRVPERRKLSRKGFSFFDLPESEVIAIWDDLFMHSPNGDVLFCALDYLRFRVRKKVSPDLWSIIRHWAQRVENWAHSDEMSWVYSYVLEAYFNEVFEDLERWNQKDELWPKRISIVSLIHYTGKNSVFLPPKVVFPMVERCIDDHRYYMQKATGWVLREMYREYPEEIEKYLESRLDRIGNSAFTRSIERMERSKRDFWRETKRDLQ